MKGHRSAHPLPRRDLLFKPPNFKTWSNLEERMEWETEGKGVSAAAFRGASDTLGPCRGDRNRDQSQDPCLPGAWPTSLGWKNQEPETKAGRTQATMAR